MFVVNFLGNSAQSPPPTTEPVREWPAPAQEAKVSANCGTKGTSDHDGFWSYVETINPRAMSWLLGTSDTAAKPNSAPPAPRKRRISDTKVVYYLGILRPSTKPGSSLEELVFDKNASMYNFLTRPSVEQGLSFSATLAAERIPVGQRMRVEYEGKAIYAYNTASGFCVVLVTDAEDGDEEQYVIPAGSLLAKTADRFKAHFELPKYNIRTDDPIKFAWPEIKSLRVEAETVHRSGFAAVQRDLDETKMVLHETIDKVLQRGEKMDELVAKSALLGDASKAFYKVSKKQNSCCVVM